MGLTNDATRPLSNPKIVFDVAGSTLGGASLSGTGTYSNAASDPFITLGDVALDAGASNDATKADKMNISAIAGDADIVLQVSVPTEDATVYTSNGTGSTSPQIPYMDTSNSTASGAVNTGAITFIKNTQARQREGARSPDGKHVYFGHSQLSVVIAVDTLTNKASAIPISITNQYAATPGVTVSPDGTTIYATQLDGDHIRGGAPGTNDVIDVVRLIKIDSSTEKELARVELSMTGGQATLPGQVSGGVPYEPTLSEDGSLIVIPMKDSAVVYLVKTSDMSIMESYDFSADTASIRRAAISPDNKFIYLADKSSGLWVADVATGTLSPVTNSTGFGRATGMRFDPPDGSTNPRSLYLTRSSTDIEILTFAAGDYSMPTGASTYAFSGTTYGFDFGPYGKSYYLCNNGTLVKVDKASNTAVYTTSLGSRGHACVVSAY